MVLVCVCLGKLEKETTKERKKERRDTEREREGEIDRESFGLGDEAGGLEVLGILEF